MGRAPAPAPAVTAEPPDLGRAERLGHSLLRHPLLRHTLQPHPLPILPAQAATDRLQRLVLVPFKSAEKALTNFATKHTGGMAGGVSLGTPGKKIGKTEKLVIVGHGNGAEIYSHESSMEEGFQKMSAAELASYLIQHVLPNGYEGEIVVWSCSAARPWGKIPEIEAQLDEEEDAELFDQSFIRQLEAHLDQAEKGYEPTVSGPVGFVTLDRDWRIGKVYADEELKLLGNTLEREEGFISTRDEAPSEFYEEDDEEEDDDYYDSSSEMLDDTKPETGVRGYIYHDNYGVPSLTHGYIEDGTVTPTGKTKLGYREVKIESGSFPIKYQTYTVDRPPPMTFIGLLVWMAE